MASPVAAAPARITARVEDIEDQEHELPAAPRAPAVLPKDWELPGLPAEMKPGLRPGAADR